ncbi:hypothetical protein F2Q68_00010800 [Brassica cretica]|uniref:Uncharacterized protein n=1 Tax=Brassica cretica TaxID=69181 RepID=A0A3N6RWS1_BRACR|nr:hypothetical protein F2Q68_00010800 [Brassica cretica]
MIHYPVLRPRHLIVHTEERRNDQVRFEGRNRFRLIGHSPVQIHPKAMAMAYPVHTLDVRSGVPVAVCFTFSLRSTMFGSIFKGKFVPKSIRSPYIYKELGQERLWAKRHLLETAWAVIHTRPFGQKPNPTA